MTKYIKQIQSPWRHFKLLTSPLFWRLFIVLTTKKSLPILSLLIQLSGHILSDNVQSPSRLKHPAKIASESSSVPTMATSWTTPEFWSTPTFPFWYLAVLMLHPYAVQVEGRRQCCYCNHHHSGLFILIFGEVHITLFNSGGISLFHRPVQRCDSNYCGMKAGIIPFMGGTRSIADHCDVYDWLGTCTWIWHRSFRCSKKLTMELNKRILFSVFRIAISCLAL